MKAETIGAVLTLGVLFTLVLVACLGIGDPNKKGPPNQRNGDPLTFNQCQEACAPNLVALYNPFAYWHRGHPRSRNEQAPCMCSPMEAFKFISP